MSGSRASRLSFHSRESINLQLILSLGLDIAVIVSYLIPVSMLMLSIEVSLGRIVTVVDGVVLQLGHRQLVKSTAYVPAFTVA